MNAIEATGQQQDMHDPCSAGDVTDAQIIEHSRRTPNAFGAIFDRHYPTIARFIRRRLPDGQADDTAGEVFRIAFERRHQFDRSRSSARPWLYGIATNLVHNDRRRETRGLRALGRMAGTRTLDEDPFDRVDRRLDAARALTVADVLALLNPGDRDVLVLCAVEELSYAEVAEALSIPVGTVRSRMHRIRRHLRERIGPDGQQLVDRNEEDANHA